MEVRITKGGGCCAPHYERSQVVNIPACLNKILLGNEIQCTGCLDAIGLTYSCFYIKMLQFPGI